MINVATPTTIGGVKLRGALAGGDANTPTIPSGYVTPAMLSLAYATAATVTAEISRAEAAEATLATGYVAAVDAEIAARISALSSEAATRSSVDAAIYASIATLQGQFTAVNNALTADVAALNASITAETSARTIADTAITGSVTTVAGHLATETTRATTAEGTKASKSANLSDLANAVTARTNLGLGSAATHPASDFDSAGAAATVQTALTAETSRAQTAEAAKLAKASNLSDVANAATARTNLGLGSAATHPASDFDTAGLAATETARAEAAEALKANDNAVLHLTGNETITGTKNFTGTLQRGGNAVVDTTDSRLSNTRVPTDGSVTDAKIASGGLTNAAIAANAAIARTKLDAGTQTSLGRADTAVRSVNGRSGTAVTLIPSDIAAIPTALVTTKGDLIGADGNNSPQRIPVGANGTVPVADNTRTLGMRWDLALLANNDLGDLISASAARTNLGLKSSAVVDFNVANGTAKLGSDGTLAGPGGSGVNGLIVTRDRLPLNIKDPLYAVTGDVIEGVGTMGAGSHSLTLAPSLLRPGGFTLADVGKMIFVLGAGQIQNGTVAMLGVPLQTTISSVSGGVATLAGVAAQAVTSVRVIWGSDQRTAIAQADNDAFAAGALLYFPGGGYFTPPLRANISGAGDSITTLFRTPDLTINGTYYPLGNYLPAVGNAQGLAPTGVPDQDWGLSDITLDGLVDPNNPNSFNGLQGNGIDVYALLRGHIVNVRVQHFAYAGIEIASNRAGSEHNDGTGNAGIQHETGTSGANLKEPQPVTNIDMNGRIEVVNCGFQWGAFGALDDGNTLNGALLAGATSAIVSGTPDLTHVFPGQRIAIGASGVVSPETPSNNSREVVTVDHVTLGTNTIDFTHTPVQNAHATGTAIGAVTYWGDPGFGVIIREPARNISIDAIVADRCGWGGLSIGQVQNYKYNALSCRQIHIGRIRITRCGQQGAPLMKFGFLNDSSIGGGYIGDPGGYLYDSVRQARTDTVTTTNGLVTVADTTIGPGDAGRPVAATGILPNSFVGTVVPGVSFSLSSSPVAQVDAPANASGTVSATLGAIGTQVLVLHTSEGRRFYNGEQVHVGIPGSSTNELATITNTIAWHTATGQAVTGSTTLQNVTGTWVVGEKIQGNMIPAGTRVAHATLPPGTVLTPAGGTMLIDKPCSGNLSNMPLQGGDSLVLAAPLINNHAVDEDVYCNVGTSTGLAIQEVGYTASHNVHVGNITIEHCYDAFQATCRDNVGPPPAATVALVTSSGNLGIGLYRYYVSYQATAVTSPDSPTSPEVSIITDSSHKQVTVTLPIGPGSTIGRKVYRTPVNGLPGEARHVATISDNTTTTFVDNVPDYALGVSRPVPSENRYHTLTGVHAFRNERHGFNANDSENLAFTGCIASRNGDSGFFGSNTGNLHSLIYSACQSTGNGTDWNLVAGTYIAAGCPGLLNTGDSEADFGDGVHTSFTFTPFTRLKYPLVQVINNSTHEIEDVGVTITPGTQNISGQWPQSIVVGGWAAAPVANAYHISIKGS